MLKFIVATFVGFIVYFMLAWLIYGVLFSTLIPHPEETPQMMYMVTAGCLFTSMLLAYIFIYLGGAANASQAIRNGGILMGLLALTMHAFTYDCMKDWTWTHRFIDLVTNIFLGMAMGWSIWFVSSKMGTKEN